MVATVGLSPEITLMCELTLSISDCIGWYSRSRCPLGYRHILVAEQGETDRPADGNHGRRR